MNNLTTAGAKIIANTLEKNNTIGVLYISIFYVS